MGLGGRHSRDLDNLVLVGGDFYTPYTVIAVRRGSICVRLDYFCGFFRAALTPS